MFCCWLVRTLVFVVVSRCLPPPPAPDCSIQARVEGAGLTAEGNVYAVHSSVSLPSGCVRHHNQSACAIVIIAIHHRLSTSTSKTANLASVWLRSNYSRVYYRACAVHCLVRLLSDLVQRQNLKRALEMGGTPPHLRTSYSTTFLFFEEVCLGSWTMMVVSSSSL